MNIDPTIFRAYDIRGIFEQNLTPEIVTLIGQAIGSEAQEQGEQTVFVGRDGRISSPILSQALCNGITASGCNVVDLGMVPTPVLYFATAIFDSHSGVMLTGSHNPANYNGLKIVIAKETLALDRIQNLYQRITTKNLLTANTRGHIRQKPLIEHYIQRICGDVKLKRPLKVVVDCGNGVGGVVIPELYSRLGCNVVTLFGKVDGTFPNHHPDPSEPKNLQTLIATVKKAEADVGLALDGDCDRLGVVTNKGAIIWPDREVMLFAIDVLSRNPGAEIIYDVKCTNHLHEVILAHGGKPIMWKTGHSFIKEKLQHEKHALLAGEMSGHMFFKERWYGFDDALYAGARLLEIIANTTESIDATFLKLPDSVNTPELRLPIADTEKFNFMEKFKRKAQFPGGEIITIDGVRVNFSYGFGLIRPSNTTPYLILRFEANTKKQLVEIQELFRTQILKVNADLELPF